MTTTKVKSNTITLAFLEQNLTKFGYLLLIKFIIFLAFRENTSTQEVLRNLDMIILIPLAFFLPTPPGDESRLARRRMQAAG